MRLIQERSNGLDILVNNAGILRDKTIRKLTLDDWRAVMDVNLDGVFHCCKYGVEILRDNGRIVSIASIAGLFPFHGQSNYASAKAGVIALTKVLAKELARQRGITANAIAPGVIQTSMLGDIKPKVMEGYLKMIPLGRLGQAGRCCQRGDVSGQRRERLHHRASVAGYGGVVLSGEW